jgi:hypothetical protein
MVVPLVVCAGYLFGAGVTATRYDKGQPCRTPSNETALIAAYSADPMLTIGMPTRPSGQPTIEHVCDQLVNVDSSHPIGYTEVNYVYPVAADYSPDLLALYSSGATAEGWVYAGSGNHDAAQFCRSVDGVASTLTIAVAHDINAEVREIVSIPVHARCPFQADVWGPAYDPWPLVRAGVVAASGTDYRPY